MMAIDGMRGSSMARQVALVSAERATSRVESRIVAFGAPHSRDGYSIDRRFAMREVRIRIDVRMRRGCIGLIFFAVRKEIDARRAVRCPDHASMRRRGP